MLGPRLSLGARDALASLPGCQQAEEGNRPPRPQQAHRVLTGPGVTQTLSLSRSLWVGSASPPQGAVDTFIKGPWGAALGFVAASPCDAGSAANFSLGPWPRGGPSLP